MTRSLTVKKEIRALGLDLCNPRRLVGAVTRGGDYLDGVLVLPSQPTLKTTSIAFAILRTRFFPELRLIMTHDPEARLEAKVIERLTKLPVVQLDSTRKRWSSGFESCKVGRKQLHVKSSFSPKVLQEILSTTWTTGTLPEPLRIAHLLARSRFSGKNARFQANK
ncbi:MAG: hypothetical protein AUI97_08685 [Crenarchaeota archaeon 13_1_40CM_3_52_17]|nr:MAG: hypothetical protein AUI97_08685 [Crenarchaeota archaeon 13_1_40CM_3_52_17]